LNIRVRISPVLIVAVTILVDLTGFGMIIPLIPFYATRLGASPTSIGVLVSSFSIMQVLFSPILGRISDSVGRRPVLLFSILTSFASFALFAVATSFEVLVVRIHPQSNVRKTTGVKRLIAEIAKRIQGEYPDLIVGKTSVPTYLDRE
jgi:MFS family permease